VRNLVRVALLSSIPSEIVQQHDRPRYPSLSLAYLSSVLKANGFEVLAIDAKFDGISQSEVIDAVTKFRPHVIGFTAMTHEIVNVAKLARRLGDNLSTSLMLIGGPHATVAPVRTLQKFTTFDLAVVGEGEQTLLDIVRRVATYNYSYEEKKCIPTTMQSEIFDSIDGIVWRCGLSIVTNKPREFKADLDSLPFPNYNHIRRRIETYPIYSSRGCPYNCIFCCRILGSKIRSRSPQNVVNEIKQAIIQFQPKLIDFADEVFTFSKERVHAVCDLIIQEGLSKTIKWTAQSRVTGVDQALFQKMKAAGCINVDFGIESGNPDVLKRIKKGITLNDAHNAVMAAKKAGLKTGSYFIIGHPYETAETVTETIKFATKLNTDMGSFGIMVPYPGTEVYEMALRKEGGYRLLSKQWQDYDKQLGNALELDNLPRGELEKWQRKAYFEFYFRNFRCLEILRLAISQRRLLWRMLRKMSHFQFTL